MDKLTLKIVTPRGGYGPYACDSIHLTVSDNAKGKGGGSYGIRAGHIKALLSLSAGKISAYRSGGLVLAGVCGNGFATVAQDAVTVVAEEYTEQSKG